MRKMHKTINIALIFMLIGVCLFADISYALRPPVLSSDLTALRQRELQQRLLNLILLAGKRTSQRLAVLPKVPYIDLLRGARHGLMAISPETLRSIFNFSEKWSADKFLASKDNILREYFGFSRAIFYSRRSLSRFDRPLSEPVLKRRLENPSISLRDIQESYRHIGALLKLSEEDRAELGKYLKSYLQHKNDYIFTLHHYSRVVSEKKGDEKNHRLLYYKTIFYLEDMLQDLSGIRDIFERNNLTGLEVFKKLDHALNAKTVRKIYEYFSKFQFDSQDMPNPKLEYKGSILRRLGFKPTPFWQCMYGRIKGTAPIEILEKAREFQKLNDSLGDQDRFYLANVFIPGVETGALEELSFYLGGVRMITDGHYSIPHVTDQSGVIQLKDSWNPVAGEYEKMDKMDITLGDDSNCFVVTGSNEIGKSTTIKIPAISILLMQMGLPIPAAQESMLGIFRNIYTIRPGFQNIKEGESQHTGLIKQLKELTDKVGPRDLVIIDEAHMGSGYADLSALTAVFMEDLIKTGASVCYATHLKSAVEILSKRIPYIKPLQVLADADTRKLQPGIARHSFAIDTLGRLGFPKEIIDWTNEYYSKITGNKVEVIPQDDSEAVVVDEEKYRGGEDLDIFKKACKALFPEANFYYDFDLLMFHISKDIGKDIEDWQNIDLHKIKEWKKYLSSKIGRTIRFKDVETRPRSEWAKVLREFDNAIKQDLRGKIRVIEEIMSIKELPFKSDPYLEEAIKKMQSYIDRDFYLQDGYFETDDLETDEMLFNTLRNQMINDVHNIMNKFWDRSLGYIDFMTGMAISIRENKLHFAEKIGKDGIFTIKSGRNPFITNPVPIDFQGDSQHPKFIIRGPNRSGKTSAVQMFQIFNLLARNGLPVPAEEYKTPIYDRMLTFFGAEENMSQGDSYFRSVAKRLLSIIQNATSDSLIIMDELHGSDYWELSALQAALIRYFDKIGATVFLNTHMKESVAELKGIKSVEFLKTDVDVAPDGELIYHYTISPDPNLEAKSYGIESVRELLTSEQYRRTIEIRDAL